MKKMVTISVVLCVLAIQGRTQDIQPKQVNIETRIVETSRFFVEADMGFAFGTHSEIFYQFTGYKVNDTSYSSIVDAIKGRLGTGLPMGIAGGYMFNKNFGVELGVEFFQGLNTKVVDNNVTGETKILISAPHLGIIPAVIAQFPMGKVIPYIKLGIDIGVINDVETRTTDASSEKDTRDYGGLSIGVKTAAGIEFPITKLFSVFGEIDARQFSYSPKHGKVFKYTVNGKDELSGMTTHDSKWDYVKSFNGSSVTPSDQPAQYLRQTHSIDNVGVAFGVRFSFRSLCGK